MNRKITIRSYKDIPDSPLSKEEVEDIILNGTPKEKAILTAIGYTDRRIIGDEPVISRSDYDRIVASLNAIPLNIESEGKPKKYYVKNSSKDFTEYLKWVRTYSLLVQVYNLFERYYLAFKANLAKVERYLSEFNEMEQEEQRLNDMYKKMKDYDKNVADYFLKSLPEHYANAKLRVTGEIVLDATLGYIVEAGQAKSNMMDCFYPLRTLIIAIEQWIKKKRISAITPPALMDRIEEVKNYSHSSPLLEKFREETIEREEAEGVLVSEARERMRIFDYVEYDPELDKSSIEGWNVELKLLEDGEKKKYQ